MHRTAPPLLIGALRSSSRLGELHQPIEFDAARLSAKVFAGEKMPSVDDAHVLTSRADWRLRRQAFRGKWSEARTAAKG
jgi:hypothetical protein